MSKRTLVTSALPYANGPLHLGHLAGAYLPADLYVRYKRLQQEDIIHICGSDEHGVPITLTADREGISPKEVVDKYHKLNKEAFERIDIEFDYFGRTSSPVHHKTSQDFFLRLNEQGVFKQQADRQLYDRKAGMFLPDRYVKGDCPQCEHREAYGDQCERCGVSLSPEQLGNPRSVITGEVAELRETTQWILPLGDFQPRLEEWLGRVGDEWKANVMGQIRSWLNLGLGDRAVTRDLKWGVPVPLKGAEGKVLYVWFDAPIGYISATREWAKQQGDPEAWRRYWQDEQTDLIHFIGKDNIVFHCIMFPAMLMAHGEYILPRNVPANEFLNLEGNKLSTSRGWAVWLHEYLDRFEPDLLRYVLGTVLPEGRDSDFSWDEFQARVNNDLADVLGNFAYRTLSFTANYFDGAVPALTSPTDRDRQVLDTIKQQEKLIADAYENFRFREALQQTMELARIGNKYFTEMEPWHLRKNDLQRCGTVLHVCCQLTAALAVLFGPVMPRKMGRLRSDLQADGLTWNDLGPAMLGEGHPVQKGEILFKKIEDETIAQQREILHERYRKMSGLDRYEPLKETTDINSFAALDIRAGQIIQAEQVEKSDKLIKTRVDLGFEQRTILAGLAQQYSPEELTGLKVCVLANLKPKKMMGIESNGMILMAEDTDGRFHPITTEAEPGSRVS